MTNDIDRLEEEIDRLNDLVSALIDRVNELSGDDEDHRLEMRW